MKCYVAAVLLIAFVAWLAGARLDEQERRIVQLECALAQAHAENDTLEAMLELCEQGNR